MKHTIDTTFTLNDSFEILFAEQDFYLFLDKNIYYPITKIMLPEEAALFEKEVAALKIGESTNLILSLRNSEEEYERIVFYIRKKQLYDTGEVFYEVTVRDVNSLCTSLERLTEKLDIYRTFLSYRSQVYFEYYADTQYFKLYTVAPMQNITFYAGNFELWKMETESQYVKEESKEKFEHFCEDIKNLKKHFSYSVMTSVLTRGEEESDLIFSGVSLKRGSMPYAVAGTVMPAVESDNDAVGHDYSANEDPLTQLLNCKEVRKIAEEMLAAPNEAVTLCILDVDNFKMINDTYGHAFGDEVLINIAKIIKDAVADKGYVGRIGGDEFLMVLENITEEMVLRSILKTIRTSVEFMYRYSDIKIVTTCSIGAASAPKDTERNYDALFKLADDCLYIAKEKGRNRYVFYNKARHGDDLKNLPKNTRVLEFTDVTPNRFLTRIFQSLIVGKTEILSDVLEYICKYFNFDRIALISAPDFNIVVETGMLFPNQLANYDYLQDELYLSLFEKSDSYFTNSILHVDNLSHNVYTELEKRKICSYAQLVNKDEEGKINLMMTCENCEFTRVWSKEDMLLLNVVFEYIKYAIIVQNR